MAEQKKTFPMLPVAHWWTLRTKFKQSIPGVVTDSYLATVLKMEAQSARANVLPYLKTLGIIDGEGKTTERAKLWRDDGRYPAVCKEMLKEVYPSDLLDAVTDPKRREDAESWFSHETGLGESAVGRMAALYVILLEADATKQAAEKPNKVAKQAAKKTEKTAPPSVVHTQQPPTQQFSGQSSSQHLDGPGIHINLEVHISADSTPDQIDAIFASMAKHIYKRG